MSRLAVFGNNEEILKLVKKNINKTYDEIRGIIFEELGLWLALSTVGNMRRELREGNSDN